MNLGKNFVGFLGRSLSIPTKLMGELTTFVKEAIRGFGGMKGGCCRGGIEEEDEMLNLRYSFVTIGLAKMDKLEKIVCTR